VSLAAVIIARDEEANILRCVKSAGFCDKVIVVVDARSTDRTVEVAQRAGAEVHVVEWRGYTEQKNLAVNLTSADWVLSLDADEEVSPALREEILSTVRNPGSHAAFSMPRKTMHFGRWIRYGGWYPNRNARLFRKGTGEWVGSEVHERWQSAGSVGDLRSDLIHYSFSSLADQVARNNRYSSLSAVQLQKAGKHFSTFRLFVKSASKFIETYFLKRGFLDGYPGFIISVSAAYSVFLKWAKLWELENGGQKG